MYEMLILKHYISVCMYSMYVIVVYISDVYIKIFVFQMCHILQNINLDFKTLVLGIASNHRLMF